MTYETLQQIRIGAERITLIRKGREFRVVCTSTAKVETVARSMRWRFRHAQVAWPAFAFVVATERYWEVTLRAADVTTACESLRRAARVFRTAALRFGEPAEFSVAAAMLRPRPDGSPPVT